MIDENLVFEYDYSTGNKHIKAKKKITKNHMATTSTFFKTDPGTPETPVEVSFALSGTSESSAEASFMLSGTPEPCISLYSY
jgi:hypothetical protein